jgi:fumarate hydratase, class II
MQHPQVSGVTAMRTRIEKDSLGKVNVPADALWGAQTQRAVDNFRVSELKAHPQFVASTVQIKKAAARIHGRVGWLDKRFAVAIVAASDRVLKGGYMHHFVVDVYQAGAGTSHNMNVNEVIANLASKRLRGKAKVHPNDHVNMGQSTNDVIPTAMRLTALCMSGRVLRALDALALSFKRKAVEFRKVVKSGRTHLQDAAPVTLGQEFNAYASCVARHARLIRDGLAEMRELGIGGSAVGTGLNTHKDYRRRMVSYLSEQTGEKLKLHPDPFEAMQSMAPFTHLSGLLRNLALDLNRIANDFRLMASGPLTGFGELLLPARQPGSSIMPGKVNPVMAESLNMVCYQVIGHDATVAWASQAGQLELNVMMPVIAYNLNQSLLILEGGIEGFRARCVEGVKANAARCLRYAEKSLSVATALNPVIGYEKASEAVKTALAQGITIREAVLRKGWLTGEQFDERVSWDRLTHPHRFP